MQRHRIITLIAALVLCQDLYAGSRRAILIGIDNYNSGDQAKPITPKVARKALSQGDVRYWSYQDLSGPINDIALIEGVLKSTDFSFEDADIVKLIDADASAQAILSTLQAELVDHASPGDIRFVYYSGHGNFIRNKGSKEQDNLDQTIVPADNRFGIVDVRDKELSRILWASAKKGVVVTFIADSCHSGSLSRGPQNGRVVRSNHGVRRSGSEVDLKEPIVDDPPSIDPKTGKSIDPEEIGVLTLSAAQRNQESIEQTFTDDPTHQVHGALTLALVRALQTEGPHASMNVIFDDVLSFLSAENLSQKPVLGGESRGEKDILGQIAAPSSFSVSVEAVKGKDIILRGGQAIGIYPGCELTRISRHAGDPSITLSITDSQSLSQSTAQIVKGAGEVAIGDRFEVTQWAVPPESVLRVYIPKPANAAAIRSVAENLTVLATDGSVKWISDPTQENPTDILHWNGNSWMLEHVAGAVSSADLGQSPTASDVRTQLTSQSRFYLLIPPTPELIGKVDLGTGKRNAVEKVTNGNFSDAQYGLFGRLQGSTVEYAWVVTDGELRGKRLGDEGASLNRDDVRSSLPIRTDWYQMSGTSLDQLGSSLTDSASRLGTIRAWLKLQGRPGQTAFPYDLVLRKVGAAQTNVAGGKLVEGEEYKLYLNLKTDFKRPTVKRRWIYVFDIDQNGNGTLIFPELGRGNEGNHLPLAVREEDAAAPKKDVIPLFTDKDFDFKVSAPFGVDTFILLTSDQPIDHPQIFQFPGVKFKSPKGANNALENLLSNVGSSERSVTPNISPGEWSVQRLMFTSVQK